MKQIKLITKHLPLGMYFFASVKNVYLKKIKSIDING